MAKGSKNIKGLMVEISGDTHRLTTALKDVDEKGEKLGKELTEVNKLLKLDPTNVEAVAQKQQILTEAVKNSSERLDELKKYQEQIKQQFADKKIDRGAYLKFEQEVLSATSQLSNYQEELDATNKAAEAAAKGVKKTGDNAKRSGDDAAGTKAKWDKFKSIVSGAAKAAAAAVAAVGAAVTASAGAIGAFAKSSVETGMSFDSSMSQIAATMGMTSSDIENNVNGVGDTFEALRNKAKEMGAATNFSATEAAEGLNILAMSGYDATSSMEMIEDVLHLAAAGNMNMAQSADFIAGAMKGFNDETKNSAYYADLMAKGATLANTSVTELGEAMSGGAATAAAYGQEADSMTLALLRLAEQGVSGSAASTTLNAAMKDLYTPTDSAKKALSELGVATYDEFGNARELNTVINELDGALADMSEEEANAYKSTIFQIQGLQAFNKMTVTSTEKQEEWAAALAEASGEASRQYATMTDNLQGDIDIWNSALDGFKIAISDKLTPAVREFVQFGSNSMGELTKAFEADGISGAMQTFGGLLSQLLEKIIGMLPQMISAGMSLLTALIQGISDNLPLALDAAMQMISIITQGLLDNLPIIIGAGMQMILTLANGIAGALPELMPTIVDVVLDIVNMLLDNVDMLIDAAIAIMMGLADGLIEALPVLLERAPEIIGRLVEAIMEAVPKLIEAVFEIFYKVRTAFAESIPLLIESIAGMIAEIGLKIADGAKAWVRSFEDLGGRIYDWSQELKTKLKEAFEKIINNIKDSIKPALDIGKNIIDGIANGIKEQVGKVKDKVKAACSELLDGVKSFFGIHSPSTVFKEQVGVNLAAGLSEGFIEQMDKLSGDMSDAVPDDYKIGVEVTDTVSAKKAIDVLIKDYESGLLNKAQYDKLYNQTLSKCVSEREKVVEYANQKLTAADKKAAQNRQKEVLSIAKEQINGIVKAYEDGEISLQEMSELYNQVYRACADERVEIEEYADEKISEARKKAAENNLKELKSSIKSEIAEYQKQIEDIQKSIASTSAKLSGDIADMYSFEADDSGKMTAKLNDMSKKQMQLNQYYSNLKKLTDSGISDAMIEQLADMSLEQGAALAESWAKMSTAELNGVASKFDNLSRTSDKISALLYDKKSKQVSEAMIESLSGIVAGSEEFAEVGSGIMDKMLAGLTDGSSTDKIKAACDNIVKAFAKYLDIDIDTGLEEQIKNVSTAFDNSVPSSVNGVVSGATTRQTYGSSNVPSSGNTTIFNQYNTSPKALSRAEIAQDTKRQLQLSSIL